MADTIHVPRTHLIMGLCLPLAVLLGYLLASPFDSGSIAVISMVLCLLSVPLFMKWHHPLLVLSWNMLANPLFLPGRPALWMVMSIISLFFAILARSVTFQRRFIQAPSIVKPLVFLMVVVIFTALLTGGVGLRTLGSNRFGGRHYFYLLAAVAGYFALTSQRIPPHRVSLYLAIYFLAGLSALIGDLAFAAGPSFYFLTAMFVPDLGMDQMPTPFGASASMTRWGALSVAGAAIYSWMLARHGIRGILDLHRPHRLLLILMAVCGCLISGFRSSLLLFGVTFACVFWFEGLYRTRWLPILGASLLLGAALVLPQAHKLPFMAQRTLSFVPGIQIDPIAKEGAQGSTDWRVEMWKQVLPQVPQYLIKGKGYAIDPNDLFMEQQSSFRGFGIQAATSMVAGDYHNGPLSILIPFGLFGMVAFIWLCVAGLRVLYYHYRFGNPTLHRVNTFLLASFVAKILMFTFIFGGLSSDLCSFVGVLGFSLSLNGSPKPQPSLATEPTHEPLTVLPERVY